MQVGFLRIYKMKLSEFSITTSNLSAYQAARSKWIEPLLLTSSSVPAAAPGRAGQSGAAGRTLFLSRSRFPCSPDRISQNPCSHGTGVCLTPGLLTLQFCLNDHRESPPISMRLLWLPFITSSMLIIALVGNIAPVSEHPVLLVHALRAVLFIVIKSVEVFVILEVTGLADHVLAVFGGRVRARGKVKEVKAFRKVFDLCRGLWLCQRDHGAQLFHIRI